MRRFHSRVGAGWRVASDWSPWKHRIEERHVSRWTSEERKVPDVQMGRAGTLSQAEGRRTSPETDVIHTRALHGRRTRRRRMRACGRFNVSSVVAMRRGGIWWEQRSGTVKAGFCACCIWIQTSDRALSLSPAAHRAFWRSLKPRRWPPRVRSSIRTTPWRRSPRNPSSPRCSKCARGGRCCWRRCVWSAAFCSWRGACRTSWPGQVSPLLAVSQSPQMSQTQSDHYHDGQVAYRRRRRREFDFAAAIDVNNKQKWTAVNSSCK